MGRITSGLRWGALGALVGLLGACDYFGGSQLARVAHVPSKKAHAQQPVDPTAKALAAMVEAVGASDAQPPIELRFSIHARPEVGQDDEVDYAVVPQVAGLETIHLAFGARDGLQVKSRGPILAAINPATGVPIFGSITIRPFKAGLFTLSAAVAVESSAGDSVVWPFTIPIIAGEGPAQTAANQP